MKKITAILFLSIAIINIAYSQTGHPCGNPQNWDWTSMSSYDFAYINGQGKVPLSSPFHTTASADETLTDIIRGKDFLPTEGWVLLRKVFGCPAQNIDTKFPHFMLYNKYRGIIRLFIFNGSSFEYQKAAITVSWDYGTNKTSVFAPSEIIQSPNHEYHQGTKVSNDIVNYVQNYYSAAWFVTDIPVTFDHLLDYTKDFYLRISVNSSINSTVNLKSVFTMRTQTVTTNASPPKNGMYEFAKETQDMLSKVPSQDQFKKYFDNFNQIVGSSKGEKELQNVASEMSKNIGQGGFQQFMSSAAGVASLMNGSIGAGLGLINFFMGKSNKNAVPAVQLMPLVSNGEGAISGEISTYTNATSYPLQLPATNHYFDSKTLNYDGLPIYDCPLGVISLEESPTLSRREYMKTIASSGGFNWGTGDFWYYTEDAYYQELSLSSAIKLAHNVSSDTEILEIKAQLVAKSLYPYKADNKYSNEMYSRIDNGESVLLDKKDEADVKNFTYATKMVDIENLRNQKLVIISAVELDNDGRVTRSYIKTPVYLKLFISMKPKDKNAGQTPILYIATYQISGTGTKGFGANGKTLQINKYFENCNCYKNIISTTKPVFDINYALKEQALKIYNTELTDGQYKLYKMSGISASLIESGKFMGGDNIYIKSLVPSSNDIYILTLESEGYEKISHKFQYK